MLFQGTLGAEIVDQVPDCDAVFVAVGGGGMASGVAKYIGETKPEVKGRSSHINSLPYSYSVPGRTRRQETRKLFEIR